MDNRRTKGLNITTLPSEILEIMTAKVAKTSLTPLNDIVSLNRSYVIHGLVHHFVVTISIMTNGNALWLLVQMHGLPQHDDDKEGGIEYGGVLGILVAVPKLRAVRVDALVTLCCSMDW
jgi:hypothetical protein